MTSNEQFEKWWKVRIQQDYGFPLSYRSAASAVWHARDDEIATLEAKLTRRDAAFAALVKHVRMEYEMHEGLLPCPPDANCDNSGCPCEHWIARHTQMQSDCREALKLAERVEG